MKNKNNLEYKHRFSLRKLSIGVCSVALSVIEINVTSMNNSVVKADEVNTKNVAKSQPAIVTTNNNNSVNQDNVLNCNAVSTSSQKSVNTVFPKEVKQATNKSTSLVRTTEEAENNNSQLPNNNQVVKSDSADTKNVKRVPGVKSYYYDGNNYSYVPQWGNPNSWQSYNNNWYHYDNYGNLSRNTGSWIDNNLFYFNNDGSAAKNTWKKGGNNWYYFGNDGHAYRNRGAWLSGNLFYFNNDGASARNAWKQGGNNWYYFGNDGHAYRNRGAWLSGNLFYFNNDGSAAKNAWKQGGNNWYYFGNDGHAYRNRGAWLSGNLFYFNNDGASARNAWKQGGNNWYYFGNDGHAYRNNKVELNGLWFIFDNEGRSKKANSINTYTVKYVYNNNIVGTKTYTGKSGQSVAIDTNYMPDNYFMDINKSFGVSAYHTIGSKNDSDTVYVLPTSQLGTVSFNIDKNYNVNYTLNGLGSFYYQIDNNAPVSINFGVTNDSVINGTLWNSSVNLKNFMGKQITFYVTPLMGTGKYNVVSENIPVEEVINFQNVKLIKNNNSDPNSYSVQFTVPKDAINLEISSTDVNDGAFPIMPNVKHNGALSAGTTYVQDVTDFINNGTKSIVITGADASTYKSFNKAVVNLPTDYIYTKNTFVVPYTRDEMLDAFENPTHAYYENMKKLSQEGWDYNKYHTEDAKDKTIFVDPRNLTSDQQLYFSNWANDLLNDARKSLDDTSNQSYDIGTEWTVDTQIQKLANDIADEYQTHCPTMRDNYNYNYTYDGHTTDGHYTEGIVRAAQKNGLNIDDNFIEDKASFQPIMDDPNYNPGDKISVDEMKRGIYRNISQMLFSGRDDVGNDIQTEYGHAHNILSEIPGNQFAISFNTFTDDSGSMYIGTHFINVNDNVKDYSEGRHGTWVPTDGVDIGKYLNEHPYA